MIYGDFASVYDDLMYDFNYHQVFDFIENIYSKCNIDISNILEIACGTGTLTEILSLYYDVDAFDFSSEMLSIAQKKVENRRNVNFYLQDMRTFNMNKKYDSCLSICDSLNYILDEKELFQVFKNVYEHLNNNGVFIFDVNTSEKFIDMDEVYVDEVEGVFYVWENFYDEDKKLNTYGVNFFLEQENNLYKRVYEEHIEKAYSIDLIKYYLEKIGFSSIEIFDDYTVNKYSESTYRAVFVARRNG